MNKKLMLRKAHRYVGLLIAVQLLAWSVGGVWFSWNDLDKIHGDHLKKHISLNLQQHILLPPQDAINVIEDFKMLESLSLIQFINNPAYKIHYFDKNNTQQSVIIDAINALPLKPINQNQAISVAKLHANFKAEVNHIELLTKTSKHHEFRNKPLPAWAVTFDHPGQPTFYIAAETSELLSTRHNSWRIFDFFWMLHTMDYEGRDDFGNWFIKIFSLIAVLTSISGIVLFIISAKKYKKR